MSRYRQRWFLGRTVVAVGALLIGLTGSAINAASYFQVADVVRDPDDDLDLVRLLVIAFCWLFTYGMYRLLRRHYDRGRNAIIFCLCYVFLQTCLLVALTRHRTHDLAWSCLLNDPFPPAMHWTDEVANVVLAVGYLAVIITFVITFAKTTYARRYVE